MEKTDFHIFFAVGDVCSGLKY